MKVFSSLKDVKVIKFSTVQDAFTGFTDKAGTFCFFSFEVLLCWVSIQLQRKKNVTMCWCHAFIFQEREEKFRNRVKRYVGIWCCVPDHSPGHIYYDMYWDEKPGWKAVPPQTSEDDHPPYWNQLRFVFVKTLMDRGIRDINPKEI